MSTIAVFNQKGGVGKTTATVHIAVAAMLAGKKVAVIDMDPQGSASAWATVRGQEVAPVVVQVPAHDLARAIEGAQADGFNFIIVDSPPGVSPLTAQIIGAVDLVVIPVKPQPLDMAAVPATLKLVGARRHVFILSDCPQRAPEVEEAKAALVDMGSKVVGVINNRRAYWRALVSGKAVGETSPKSVPASEIKAIYQSILKELPRATSKKSK
ncbi:MAG: putative ATPase, ParA type [Polaromonas sp.]|nr:putative ATPase, ParA type [Polaromonas sp.]